MEALGIWSIVGCRAWVMSSNLNGAWRVRGVDDGLHRGRLGADLHDRNRAWQVV